MGYTVERIELLDNVDISQLVKESEAEGYRFLSRLLSEFQDGTNTFNQPGEALFSVANDNNEIIAIGGVNRSIFPEDEQVARLQRFYVLPNSRRDGVGSLLLNEIIDFTRGKFKEMTVRTESSIADDFYRANGFESDDSTSVTTHILKLNV